MYMRNYSMEQSRYWMWSRRKLAGMSHLPGLVGAEEGGGAVAYHDSWEEQAFAEDAAGGLEGCVWPPRSYSCSFCRREFRSAQALGGHMNVHRRDRARLKLSSAVGRIESSHHPDHLQQQQHHHHLRSPSISCPPMAPTPHQRLAHVYGENPKPSALSGFLPGSSFSASRVSAASTPENPNERIFLVSPSFSAPSISAATNEKNNTHPYTFLSLSDHQLSLSIRGTIPELKLGNGDDHKDMKIPQLGEKRSPEKVEEFPSLKRRRIDVNGSRGSSSQGEGTPHDQSAVLGHGLSPVRELDLELRLGDPPKVIK